MAGSLNGFAMPQVVDGGMQVHGASDLADVSVGGDLDVHGGAVHVRKHGLHAHSGGVHAYDGGKPADAYREHLRSSNRRCRR